MTNDPIERLNRALDGHYRIERQVGQGGMATVYLAEDLKHRRQVAIKVLRPELSATLGTERFLREIELAAKLQHPHIVPVYDSGSADEMLYYVMPYIEGESLRDLMRREGPLSLDRAAEIIREAASGLGYAHDHGIVHRDVKPENIMLSGGHAVVTDFGIARAIDASRAESSHLTGAGMAIGTPAYMSPEQATADKVDARSDQYALACVFYELVTGKQAFSGPTMQAMLTSILTGPRPRLSAVVPGIPGSVDGATQRALSTDPDKRFNSITEFARAIAMESSGAAAASRESRRWKRLAIVLPLVVIAGTAVWAMLYGPGRREVVSGAETIAVVPFNVSGTGVEGLGEGMVDLLSVNLDGVGPIRTIEPRSVLREWRRRVDSGEGDLDDAIAVGRNTRAASVLTGSIVAAGSTARLTAELYGLDGVRLGGAQIDGPIDSVLVLADGLALALLHDIWKSREPLPSANTTGIRSASMPAIRAYLRGERYHRRGQWDSARVAFEEAVTADSTFALAWYRLANTLGWQGLYQVPLSLNAASNAVRFSDSLPPRMRALLVAYDLFAHGSPVAADSARLYTQRYPDDADGWFLLGEAQYHTRAYRPLPPDRLREPFDKVIALDSSLAPAAIHPLEVAILTGDTVQIRRYEAVFRSAESSSELRRAELARRAVAGDDSALAAMFESPSGMALAAFQNRMSRAGGSEILSLAQMIAASATDGPEGAQLRALPGMIAQALGQSDTAMAIIDSANLGPQLQEMRSYVRLMPLLSGYADPALLRMADSAIGRNHRNQYLAVWQGLMAIDMGDPARAYSFAGRVLARPDTLQRFVHGALYGVQGLALVAQGDTTRGIAVLDSARVLMAGTNAVNFVTPIEMRYAMLLSSMPTTRRRGIYHLNFGFTETAQVYPIVQYYLGRAWEAEGRIDSASVAYSRFLRLWNDSDSIYQPMLQQARDAVQRAAGEGQATTP